MLRPAVVVAVVALLCCAHSDATRVARAREGGDDALALGGTALAEAQFEQCANHTARFLELAHVGNIVGTSLAGFLKSKCAMDLCRFEHAASAYHVATTCADVQDMFVMFSAKDLTGAGARHNTAQAYCQALQREAKAPEGEVTEHMRQSYDCKDHFWLLVEKEARNRARMARAEEDSAESA